MYPTRRCPSPRSSSRAPHGRAPSAASSRALASAAARADGRAAPPPARACRRRSSSAAARAAAARRRSTVTVLPDDPQSAAPPTLSRSQLPHCGWRHARAAIAGALRPLVVVGFCAMPGGARRSRRGGGNVGERNRQFGGFIGLDGGAAQPYGDAAWPPRRRSAPLASAPAPPPSRRRDGDGGGRRRRRRRRPVVARQPAWPRALSPALDHRRRRQQSTSRRRSTEPRAQSSIVGAARADAAAAPRAGAGGGYATRTLWLPGDAEAAAIVGRGRRSGCCRRLPQLNSLIEARSSR